MKDPNNYNHGSEIRKRLKSAEKSMKIPNSLLPKKKVTPKNNKSTSFNFANTMKQKQKTNNTNFDLKDDAPSMFSMSNTGTRKLANTSKSPVNRRNFNFKTN